MSTNQLEIDEPRVRVIRIWRTSDRECREGFRRSPVMTMTCAICAKQDLRLGPGSLPSAWHPSGSETEGTKGTHALVPGPPECNRRG